MADGAVLSGLPSFPIHSTAKLSGLGLLEAKPDKVFVDHSGGHPKFAQDTQHPHPHSFIVTVERRRILRPA